MKIADGQILFNKDEHLELTSAGNPLEKTRQAFLADEMAGRGPLGALMHTTLNAFYSMMIRQAVDEGLITLEQTEAMGEIFWGKMGMMDRIQRLTLNSGKEPFQMTLAEFQTQASFFVTLNGARVLVFMKFKDQHPVERPVKVSEEVSLRAWHRQVVLTGIHCGLSVPEEVLIECGLTAH